MVVKIAVVEDDSASADLLLGYLHRYEHEKGVQFEISHFADGMNFISDYKADLDIIFMDIEMPYMDGMTAAKKLRKIDESVCLIFVTNMAKYAIKGYEVAALDFMVKPVKYFNFTMKLERALRQRENLQRAEVKLPVGDGKRRLTVSDILYIEVSNHTLIYHTSAGDIQMRGTISGAEAALGEKNFARCSNSFLVNLAKVTAVGKNSVMVGGEELQVSRSKRDEFMRRLTNYLGENDI